MPFNELCIKMLKEILGIAKQKKFSRVSFMLESL